LSTLFGPEGASPWGGRELAELSLAADLENFIASASI
jgi:hypothetical protein